MNTKISLALLALCLVEMFSYANSYYVSAIDIDLRNQTDMHNLQNDADSNDQTNVQTNGPSNDDRIQSTFDCLLCPDI